MGKKLKDDEIVIPQDDTTYESRPIPPDYPDENITSFIVETPDGTYPWRATEGCRVGAIKANDTIDMPDALALHSDDTGHTITLNDDDPIAEYVSDGETLALKPNDIYG